MSNEERTRINLHHAEQCVKQISAAAKSAAALRLPAGDLDARAKLVHVLASLNHTMQATEDLLHYIELI